MTRKRLPAAKRRRQILDAARRCFARYGYHGATTKRIAEHAHVAEALIYRHFESKQVLFTEAVQDTAEFLMDALENVFKTFPDSPMDALRAILTLYLQLLKQHQDIARTIFVITAELDDPDVSAVYLPMQARAIELVMSQLEYWQDHGLVRNDVSSRSMAWLFFGTYQTLALMQHGGQLNDLDVEEAILLAKPFILAIS